MRRLLLFLVLLLPGIALGQVDPRNGSPTTVVALSSSPTTSSAYAVISNVANEVLWFRVSGSGGATGSVSIQFTLDSESAVKAGTADWWEMTSTSTVPDKLYVESPPPYVRVVSTPTSGSLKVVMRGAAGLTFRKVQ